MKFCSACGAPVILRVPPGDDRERAVCERCDAVHYENPRVVVGCLVEHEDKLLLCRRAIEPRRGLWTPPAGFLELGETMAEGAARETREEACAEVADMRLTALFDLPRIGQSYAMFASRLVGAEFAAGIESLEVELFEPERVPWDELAFPVLRIALELYLEDRRAGRERLHLGAVDWSGVGAGFDYARCQLVGHRTQG